MHVAPQRPVQVPPADSAALRTPHVSVRLPDWRSALVQAVRRLRAAGKTHTLEDIRLDALLPYILLLALVGWLTRSFTVTLGFTAALGLAAVLLWLYLSRTYRPRLRIALAADPELAALADGDLTVLPTPSTAGEPGDALVHWADAADRRLPVARPLTRFARTLFVPLAELDAGRLVGQALLAAAWCAALFTATSLTQPWQQVLLVAGAGVAASLTLCLPAQLRCINRQETATALERRLDIQPPVPKIKAKPLNQRLGDTVYHYDAAYMVSVVLKILLVPAVPFVGLIFLGSSEFDFVLPQPAMSIFVTLLNCGLLAYLVAGIYRYKAEFRAQLEAADIARRLSLGEFDHPGGQPSTAAGGPGILGDALWRIASQPQRCGLAPRAYSRSWLGLYYAVVGTWALVAFGLPALQAFLMPQRLTLPYLPVYELLLPLAFCLGLRRLRLEVLSGYLRGILAR